MQIRHKVVRVAAAATVTVFLAAGAMSPSFAVGTTTEDSTASEETTTEQQADDRKSKGKRGTTTEPDDSERNDSTEGEDDETQPESTTDEGDESASTEDDGDGSHAAPQEQNAATTCDKLGYTKVDAPSGSVELEFGSLVWENDTLTYEINEGFTVDLCIKSGAQAPITTFVVTGADEGSKQIAQDISHIGYIVKADDADAGDSEPVTAPEETCPEGTTMNADGECVAPVEETCPEGAEMNEAGECVVPAEGETCPEGATMNDDGECVVPAEESCPEGAEMNEAGECVVPTTVTPVTTDEVAGAEAERAPGDVEGSAANRAPAEVAPASGILPATGAGQYGLILAAGAALLAAGGFLIARKRSQAGS